MTAVFDDSVQRAVLHHMNADHTDDNVLIARAFSPLPDVIAATMTTFDGDAGEWQVITADGAEDVIRIPWPGRRTWRTSSTPADPPAAPRGC